jgi:CP family cyanate transporter-like MFS transporter
MWWNTAAGYTPIAGDARTGPPGLPLAATVASCDIRRRTRYPQRTCATHSVENDVTEPEPIAATLTEPDAALAPGSAGRLLLGVSLVLIALNLRAAVASVGPVLREIARSLGLSAMSVSVLTTVPSLCFGLAAPLAPLCARRVGTERTLLIALLLLAAGIALRGWPGVPSVYAGQILATLAIGIMNVLLPGLVKRDFPDRVALMTGLYTMALCAGAAVAAGAAVPLAGLFGGSWAASLAFWAVPAAVAAAIWAVQLPRLHASRPPAVSPVRGLWRDRLAWNVMLFMGSQSALAYIVFGWLPPMLRERGLSAVDAGFALSLSVLCQAGASLFAPALATRGKDQSLPNVLGLLLCLASLMGCFFAPLPTVWIWAALLGVSQGALIALAMTVIVLRSPDARVAAQLSGMAQGGGYILASAGPLLAGQLRAWSGGWAAVALLCLAIGLAACLFGHAAGQADHVQGRSDLTARPI